MLMMEGDGAISVQADTRAAPVFKFGCQWGELPVPRVHVFHSRIGAAKLRQIRSRVVVLGKTFCCVV